MDVIYKENGIIETNMFYHFEIMVEGTTDESTPRTLGNKILWSFLKEIDETLKLLKISQWLHRTGC